MNGSMHGAQTMAADENTPEGPTLSDAKRQLADHFDRIASGREPWKRNRYYHSELARLVSFVVPEGSRVLQIGCGAGDLLAATRPQHGVGIDLSPGMVELARERHPELEFTVGEPKEFRSRQRSTMSSWPTSSDISKMFRPRSITCTA